MGLFDKPETRNLAEVFPPGTPFRLDEAWIQGVAQSPMGGVRTLARVVVSPVEQVDNQREFGVWGSLADQVRKIEPGELPLIVTLDNSTGLWLFTPPATLRGEGTIASINDDGEVVEQVVPRYAVPDAHLDLDGGESDAPTPVPPAAAPAGSTIDESSAMKPPEIPPAAPLRERPIDEAQVFNPTGDPNLDQGKDPSDAR